MPTSRDEIQTAFTHAERMLKRVDGDFRRLPPAVASFLRVHGAQGIIDNGGYVYFFESDWEGHPPYEAFADAYSAIGCEQQAAELRRVVATFPFSDPHLHVDQRQDYMEAHFDEDTDEVRGWGDALCGDDGIWDRLAEYCRTHSAVFEAS